MSDPVVDGIVTACTGATPAQIAQALKTTPGLNRQALLTRFSNDPPWTLDGAFTDRWVHIRAGQYARGTPGTLMAEGTDLGNGTACIFVYRPDPSANPALFIGSPLDGMKADPVPTIVPTPSTKAAAYALLLNALNAG